MRGVILIAIPYLWDATGGFRVCGGDPENNAGTTESA
jgi:hypothetical protein